MAELWNRVNIAFPSVVSSVRVHYSSVTDAKIKALLAENQNVLKLIKSEILEGEIRVLYELLYILNNSCRSNKTFKSLKQVEQCINRLKIMKLDVALQDLTELCPNKIQRVLGSKSGEVDVPSQPFLEWLCLKVLGGAQLMSCTLDRCSRAFILSKKHMKLAQFIVLNVVITSMLSRLWVIFRGILVRLSILYQHLLEFRSEVASAKPMPFLPEFSLPADITQVLGYTDAFLLSTLSAHLSNGRKKKQKKTESKVKNQGKTRQVKEDLGVAIERDGIFNTDPDLKPFLGVLRNHTKKYLVRDMHRNNKEEVFEKQVQEATTVTGIMTSLKEAIEWCKSQKKKKEKGLLAFVCLKCQRLKGLEAAGYNVQMKLPSLIQEALWALAPNGSAPRAWLPASKMWRKFHQKNHFHSLRSKLKSSALRAGINKKRMKRQRKRTDFAASVISGNGQKHRATFTTASQPTENNSHDDIDDIFASVGL